MKPYIKNRLLIILIAVVLIFVYKINFTARIKQILTVLYPVITAFVFAWLLIPAKVWLEGLISKNHKLSKYKNPLSAFGVYIAIVGLIVFFIIYLIPILKDGIVNVLDQLRQYYKVVEKYMDKEHLSTLINPGIYIEGAMSTFAVIYSLVMSFVVLIYVLLEHRRLKSFFSELSSVLLGSERAEKLLYYISKINTIFTGYLYGRLVSSVILGVLVTVGFMIMKMKHSVFFGITVALSNLIPIFGAFISGVPITLTALSEYGITKALIALGIIIAGQQIENSILTPKIVGDTIGLSGFWILFSVILGGGLFGFWGLLVCIPTAATIRMLYKEFLDKNIDMW